MDTGMLFNGVQYHWTVEEIPGDTAARDRAQDGSYRLELDFKIRVPKAAKTMEDLEVSNAKLSEALPGLPRLLEKAEVSEDYGQIYAKKMDWLKDRLERLEQILSRHNYYDCDTMLRLRDPQSGRRAFLVQGDMDVNVDGSDGDRNVEVDGSNQFFQPQTSYRWAKTTDRPNPFLARYQKQLEDASAQLKQPGLVPAKRQELEEKAREAKRQIADLKASSFLVSKADPSVVLPGFLLRDGSGIGVGDYVVVACEGKAYPAIVGDAGPSYKVGEASLRLCNEISPGVNALSRPVSGLGVTYLVFPGSADPKRSAPDLERWHARCTELLAEVGITNAPLHRWENVVPPWPTPTPTPEPTPSPADTNAVTPIPTPETGGPLVVTAPLTAETPAPSPSPSAQP